MTSQAIRTKVKFDDLDIDKSSNFTLFLYKRSCMTQHYDDSFLKQCLLVWEGVIAQRSFMRCTFFVYFCVGNNGASFVFHFVHSFQKSCNTIEITLGL